MCRRSAAHRRFVDFYYKGHSGWLIFVEVKYRSSERSGSPLAAVNGRKQLVISKVAVEYLKNHYRSMDVRCRFDVVGINGDKICWIKNAFDFCQ